MVSRLFEFPVSKGAAMKQLGNSVAIPVIKAIAGKIIDILLLNEKEK